MNFHILFENQNVVIVDKPGGWLSTPGRFPNDPRPCLGLALQDELKIQMFPVHRLDEETTGVIIYAKNKGAHKTLNQWFENHRVRKTYEAFTSGTFEEAQKIGSELNNKILRGKKRSYESPVGQQAHTHVEFVKRITLGLYWNLTPTTGRSHQLRFQLASRGFPIIGDTLYGSKENFFKEVGLPPRSVREHTIALRAVSLAFPEDHAREDLGLPAQIVTNSLLHK